MQSRDMLREDKGTEIRRLLLLLAQAGYPVYNRMRNRYFMFFFFYFSKQISPVSVCYYFQLVACKMQMIFSCS
jgi:hypothetical protein